MRLPSHKVLRKVVQLPRLRSALNYRGDRHVPSHAHQEVELVLTLRGDLDMDCGGAPLQGGPGTLFVLPARVPQIQRCKTEWHTQCILYYDGDHLLGPAARVINASAEPLILRWVDELCQIHSARVADSVADALLYALLARIADFEFQKQDAEALHPRLADAVHFLQENVTRDIDAENLAAVAHTSYSHLSTLFRERFGCGPLKYHQNQRMDAARRLLLNPYLSVDDVASQSGFEDTNYFVRLFRKTYGVPPGRWRKEYRASQAPPPRPALSPAGTPAK